MKKVLIAEKALIKYTRSITKHQYQDNDISRLIRATRRSVIMSVWKELEPFIGLDPRHDGSPPDWDRKCKPCAEVRRIKEKYAAAIRGRR